MMTIKRSLSRRCSTGLLSLGVLLGAAGCEFDSSGVAPGGFWITCDAEVWDCPKTATAPNFDIGGGTAFPAINNYIKRNDFWKVKNAVYQVYWHPPIYAGDPGPPELPGSTMIMTGGADWNVGASSFMQVTLNEEVAGVYVAYDSRANPKPSWLLNKNNYEKLSKQLGISMTEKTSTGPMFVNLDVYLAKNATAKGKVLALPGNNSGSPGWQDIKEGSPAMYVVFVKPKLKIDCTKGKYKTTSHYDSWDCTHAEETTALNAIRSQATTACEKEHPNDVCMTPTCSAAATVANCGTITGCTFCRSIDGGFGHSSEVAFLPATAKASGTVTGGDESSSFNSTISGTLLFDYRTDSLRSMDVMLINRMTLEVDSFDTELGYFTDIKAALISPTAAKCQDWPAPVASPCNWYQIPSGEFWTTESCNLDGDPVAFTANSNTPTDIYLDPVTHKFTIGGSLQSAVVVDGEPFEIDVTLKLVGQVINFAPKAVAEYEGDGQIDCSDGTNAETTIFAHAADSFDADGTLTNNSYAWYEDLGLVTEYFWNTGPYLEIAKGELGYGEHEITLVVTDGQGVLDTYAETVTVADTAPPLLEVPEDIEVNTIATPPIEVDIGEAFAADECLPMADDAVTNDAPADLRFDAGETLVTWTADDGRGNIATGVQRVVVYAGGGPTSIFDAIRDGIVQLQVALGHAHEEVSQCSPAEACEVDLGYLVESFDGLIMMTRDAMMMARSAMEEEGSEADEELAMILADLEAAKMALLEAAACLDESKAEDADTEALRNEAAARIAESEAILKDAAAEADAMDEDQGEPGADEDDVGGSDEPSGPGEEPSGPGEEPAGPGEDEVGGVEQVGGGGTGGQRRGLCGTGTILMLMSVPLLILWKVRLSFGRFGGGSE